MHIYGAGESSDMWGAVTARLARGEVGILPTDTIYGLSGDARQARVVDRIAAIKQRARPSSVIAPNDAWVLAHIAPLARPWFRSACARRRREHRAHLAPPETWLLPIGARGKKALPRALWQSGYLGVRLSAHFVSTLAAAAGVALVSTSVNRTTRPHMTDLNDLDPAVASEVDFLVYEGARQATPSTLFIFDGSSPRILSR